LAVRGSAILSRQEATSAGGYKNAALFVALLTIVVGVVASFPPMAG
jgi:hypothetical protein